MSAPDDAQDVMIVWLHEQAEHLYAEHDEQGAESSYLKDAADLMGNAADKLTADAERVRDVIAHMERCADSADAGLLDATQSNMARLFRHWIATLSIES